MPSTARPRGSARSGSRQESRPTTRKPTFHVLTVALVAALAVILGVPHALAHPLVESAPTPPNVVVILTDDQRYGTDAGMPIVAAELAAKGTIYPYAFVPTSWCCPSRASLLTGKYSHNSGVWENVAKDSYGAWPAFAYGGEEQDTLATRLSAAGYRTGLFGKYLNALVKAPRHYTPPGWSEFAGLTSASYTNYGLTTDDSVVPHPRRYLTDELADRTTEFIRTTPSDVPLFAMFTPYAPHSPYDAGPYAGAAEAAGVMDAVRTAAQWPNPAVAQSDLRSYPDWVRAFPRTQDDTLDMDHWARTLEEQQDDLMGVDVAVAQILAALEETGRLNNTLIIFTSDNGYTLGEHGLERKNTAYDSSIRVPLIMRYDGHLAPGTVDDRVAAANIDLYTTILRAAGVEPAAVDGVDLMTSVPGRTSMVVEAARWRGVGRPPYCGIRTRDYLFVRYGSGREEMYDYRTDPFELNNLVASGEQPMVRERLRGLSKKACQPTPPGFRWDLHKPQRVPSAPTHVAVEPRRDGSVVAVSWRAPRFTYGAELLRYVVTSLPTSQGCTLIPAAADEGLRCFVTGLRKGVDYAFSVSVETPKGSARSRATDYLTP